MAVLSFLFADMVETADLRPHAADGAWVVQEGLDIHMRVRAAQVLMYFSHHPVPRPQRSPCFVAPALSLPLALLAALSGTASTSAATASDCHRLHTASSAATGYTAGAALPVVLPQATLPVLHCH